MASDRSMELRVTLAAADKASAPMRRAMQSSNALSAALKATRDGLRDLDDKSARLQRFEKTVQSAREASAAVRQARGALGELNGKLEAARAKQAELVGPVQRLRAEYKTLVAEYSRGGQQVAGFGFKLHQAREALEKAENGYRKAQNASRRLKEEIGYATKAVSKAEERKRSYSETLRRVTEKLKEAGLGTKNLAQQQHSLKEQTEAANKTLEKQGARLQQIHAARARYDKAMERRNDIAMSGAGGLAIGAAIEAPVVKSVRDFATFEDAMMGVARQVKGARNDNGELADTYYEMARAIQEMSRRTPMATTEIAALVEAGARMGIEGKANLLAYADTAAKAATAFDAAAGEIGENIARISQLYKLPIENIGELGDVINYLDDNALAKGGDIIEVMQRIAGVTQMVKMSYRDAAALGSTFLSLGARSDIAATASNAVIRELSIATMQPKRFQAGLDALGLNDAKVQKSMNRDATGTILQVLEALRKLPEEKQLTVATQLFGKEYGDDVSKLAQNIKEYRRQIELANAEAGKGSMQREADARNAALSARWQMLMNRIFNTSANSGAGLKGSLVGIIDAIGRAVDGIDAWMQRHPGWTSAIMHTAMVLGGIVAALGALTLAMAAVLGPLAMIRLGMFLLPGAATVAFAKLTGLVSGFAGVLQFVWAAIKAANPWTLALAGLIYLFTHVLQHWEQLKTAFKAGDWIGIIQVFIQAAESALDSLTLGLYSKFKSLFGWLIDLAVSTGKKLSGLFGFDSAQAQPALAGAGAAAGSANPPLATANPPLATAPPLRLGGRTTVVTNHTPITVNAAPGQSPQDVGQEVRRQLDERERQKGVQRRSIFADAY